MVFVVHEWLEEDGRNPKPRVLLLDVPSHASTLVFDPHARAWAGYLSSRRDQITLNFFDGSLFTPTEVASGLRNLVREAISQLPKRDGYLFAVHGHRHALGLVWSERQTLQIGSPPMKGLPPPWWPSSALGSLCCSA
jgi:hypothetical protein